MIVNEIRQYNLSTMGFLKRLGRFIDGLLPEETEETLKYGQEGEELFYRYAEAHKWNVYPNRVVMDGGRFREIDAVVVAGRFLFCVEIKNWKGTVKPRDKEHWLRFKPGSNKPDTFRNAHAQALSNTYALKKYLNWSDKKMRGLWVEPLVIFVKRDKSGRDGTNADAVRGFEKGVIYLDELEKFVAWKHKSIPGDRLDYKLIMPIVDRIYTWDTVGMEKEGNLLIMGQPAIYCLAQALSQKQPVEGLSSNKIAIGTPIMGLLRSRP